MKQDVRKPPRAFFVTGPLPCPYLPGHIERRLVVELAGHDVVPFHDNLSTAGFRRSHGIAYAPVCGTCTECRPVRINAAGFTANRSHRKVLRRNADLAVTVRPTVATKEQFALFSSYQWARHSGGEMAKMDFADYQSLIAETPLDSFVAEARAPDGRLLAAGLFDRLADGLSAVYSFFDTTSAARSLGKFLILWAVEQTRAEHRDHVYLGYWIAGCGKMAYKRQFRPVEVYASSRWLPLESIEG